MTRVYTKTSTTNTTSTVQATHNLEMSSSLPTSTATPSPLPVRVLDSRPATRDPVASEQDDVTPVPAQDPTRGSLAPDQSQRSLKYVEPSTDSSAPLSSDGLKTPALAHKARLRVHLEDLTHPAVARFLAVMPISSLLQTAISNVQEHLFTPPDKHHESSNTTSAPPQTTANPSATVFQTSTLSSRPPPPQKPIHPPERWTPQDVRSVTLIIRDMDGVAYTTGTNLDNAHKEIHLNIEYIEHVMKSSAEKTNPDEEFKFELMGVITHEMVHAFQHNASSSCPGGLIEGIADYVRLNSGLGAKHWDPWPASKKTRGEKWDEGYQKTAWFLEWVERQVKKGVIGKLNYEMRHRKWKDGEVWKDVIGESVKDMWDKYECSWDEMNRKHEREKEEAEKKADNGHRPGLWL